jgi:hypothetical protein
VKDNVIRLYDARPELALEQLKRSTGLNFDELPQNLAKLIEESQKKAAVANAAPPILTDVVETPA